VRGETAEFEFEAVGRGDATFDARSDFGRCGLICNSVDVAAASDDWTFVIVASASLRRMNSSLSSSTKDAVPSTLFPKRHMVVPFRFDLRLADDDDSATAAAAAAAASAFSFNVYAEVGALCVALATRSLLPGFLNIFSASDWYFSILLR
jgi:hypothetical protein